MRNTDSIREHLRLMNMVDSQHRVELADTLKLMLKSQVGQRAYDFGPTYLILKEDSLILNGTTDRLEDCLNMVKDLREIYGGSHVKLLIESVDKENVKQDVVFMVDIDTN